MLEPRRLTTIALACFALFVASVAVMPLIASGYDPVHQTISEGVLEPPGAVQVAGLLALAGGSLALACCVVAMRPVRVVLPVAVLVAFSAAWVGVLATFPTDAAGADPTWIGRTHVAAATFAFASNAAAMLVAAWTFRHDERLASLSAASLALGLSTLLLLLMLAAGVEPRGVVQRAAVGCILVWLIALSLRLRVAAAAPATHR